MAADGNFSVFVVRCFLLHRSRLATVPALPGLARGPGLRGRLAESWCSRRPGLAGWVI